MLKHARTAEMDLIMIFFLAMILCLHYLPVKRAQAPEFLVYDKAVEHLVEGCQEKYWRDKFLEWVLESV